MTDAGGFTDVLAMARQGDEHAWSVLYDSLAGQMLGYLRGRGASDPEDLVGETFLRIARGISTFEGDEAGFRAWAFTIAHHRLVDDRRTRSRRPVAVPIESVVAPEDPVDVADVALQAASPLASREWLDVLSDEQRDVVLLRVLARLTGAEVAALLDKTEGAVRVIQHRALQLLRKHVRPEDVTS